MRTSKEYDVIIIGGGITGVGTARDCAMRGLSTVLVERRDLTNGATGRNHGLLHSGARYAVTDPLSARECIEENRILRRVAPNCIEETGGLYITLPEDDPSYQAEFVRCCRASGIEAEVLDPREAMLLDGAVNPALMGAVKVPDASVDPFRLTTANAIDAAQFGAEILTYHEVTDLIIENGRVCGVHTVDSRSGERKELRAPVTVNAAGIWGSRIASLAGINISMLPSKGSLLIFGHRVNRMVINRCRKPSNADILVPGGVVCLLGTTSSRVPFEACDDIKVTADEVDLLLKEGSRIAPSLAQTRVLRAYAGVRPLVASDDDPTGRSTSRGVSLFDHAVRDGIDGFITIAGGKLTTYRKMACMVTDLVCSKLGVERECMTAKLPLPGSGSRSRDDGMAISRKAAEDRHGTRISKMNFEDKSQVLCGCEHVTRAEIAYAVKYLGVQNLIDLRRRTRVGMGTCQGSSCMGKVAAAMAEEMGCPEKAPELIRQYVRERWKGIAPICWGEALREAEFMRKQYK